MNKRIAKKKYKRVLHRCYDTPIGNLHKGRGRHRRMKREFNQLYSDAIIFDGFIREMNNPKGDEFCDNRCNL